MTADDVMDIAEYVQGSFGGIAYTSGLRSFWDEAAELAPWLGADDRAALFSVLWGGHAPVTTLFARLCRTLAQLECAEMVHVGLDALIPRETSIIDVKTLRVLGGAPDNDDGGGPLEVRTASGRRCTLNRAELCALAAELVLPMLELPAPLFADTDLLDFPGARNRFRRPYGVLMDEAEKNLDGLFLRGKVAYLFDRYVANQEITSMLLCVPDGNMETVDLPPLVQGWIATTHGSRPELRTQVDCVLFFVLTKFDKLLGDSAAEGGVSTRFERRMFSSLLEKFGKGADNWVKNWTPDKPFRNCFWLRNPNYYFDGVFDYENDSVNKRELRVRPDKLARLSELRAGCLATDTVRQHFADPEAAWDAALALNDGGVSWLTAALAAVCKPDSKLLQLRRQLETMIAAMTNALAPLHVADDLETHIEARREAAFRVIDAIEAALGNHRLGALLAALMVERDAIEERILRVPAAVRLSNALRGGSAPGASSAAPAPGATAAAQPQLLRILRPDRRPVEPVSSPDSSTGADGSKEGSVAFPVQVMTLEQFQARGATEAWIDTLKSLRDDSARCASLCLTSAQAGDLASELIHMARRQRLAERLAEELAAINYGPSVEVQARAAAIVCSERINGFVASLGTDRTDLRDRPQVNLPDGSSRPVFVPRTGADDALDLPMQPRPIGLDLATDLAFGIEAVFLANARDVEGGERDIVQNRRIGDVLSGLRSLRELA
jgi:hypothetical protein